MRENNMTGYPSIDKPWLKYYSEEAIHAELPKETVYEYIYSRNQDNLDRIALDYYGSKFTYRQMFREISYLAGTLEREGIRAGDTVTVCMINSPETIFLVFALNKIGAIANMVYGASTLEELKKYITDTQSVVVFTLDIYAQKFFEVAKDVRIEKIIVANLTASMSFVNRIAARVFKGIKPFPLPDDSHFIKWDDFFRRKTKSSIIYHDGNAAAFITYTGGTTGGSKGAVLTNKAVLSVVHQDVLCDPDLRRGNIWMQVLPLFIAYGVTCSLTIPLAVGMTLIVRIPMAESIGELCKKFKPNHIVYGPAYWEALANSNKHIDLSQLIAPVSGGDILTEKAEAKINRYLKKCKSPSVLMNGYGMTEVGAAVSVNFQYIHKSGSVGIPFVKNVISAFDLETGKELKYGEQGEICIQTPSMMVGYVNNSEETKNIIRQHEDGQLWIHSGDLGYVTDDGFVFICGRLKRYMMYIADGLHKKIFSLDIERVLLGHPKVDNCAVVPIADPITFQAPIAFISLKKGYKPGVDIEKELRSHSEKNLQRAYRPIRYVFADEFPLTKVGKVDYLALEKMASSHEEIDNTDPKF